MANMDYPGPCFACSAIEGCTTDEARQEAVNQYCKGLEMELNAWKATLYDIMVKGEGESGFADTMNLIKSTMRELEMLADKMRNECPMDVSGHEKDISDKLNTLRTHYTQALSVISPGYFGG